MKRKFVHPAPSARELAGPKYWRSLDELAATPGFQAQVEREFPEGAATLDGVDRRQFMKIMAASFALGGVGLAGCRRPEANILPFGKSVEGIIPGLPLYYATAMPLRRSAMPLLAETHQGRPTKLEGNPGYAPHGGASSLAAQASLLELYDPDRATAHVAGGATLDDAAVKDRLAAIGNTHAATGGAGLAFLAGSSSSPTRDRVRQKLQARFPKAVWAEYEPVADEPPLAAAQAVFGGNFRPLYRFAKAKVVVSLDCDFLSAEAGSLYYAREFARARRVTNRDDPMNRLYTVESNLTLTGSMADHRLRMASSHMLALAGALAARITGDANFGNLARGLDIQPAGWVEECAADLAANKGEGLVVVGAHLPPEVHAVAHAINAALGNLGRTVDFVDTPVSGAAELGDLAAAIRSGAVRTLVILGGNPAYNAPVDLDWAGLQKSVPEVVRFGYYVDETSATAGLHVAAAHYLESWGDGRTLDGTLVPIQPMILPLFGGLTEIEVLARIAGEPEADPYKLVYETISGLAGGQAEKVFRRFLHDGVLADSAYPVVSPDFNNAGLSRLLAGGAAAPVFSATNLEVRFVADHKVDDGRSANNGWLQECPDPITKLAWDNAILISPRLAKELGIDPKRSAIQVARKDEQDFEKGVDQAHMAELTLGGRTITAPIHIQVGLSNYTIVLPLGYGRAVTGRIGRDVGFSAYAVRTAGSPHIATGGTLRITGARRVMADTQWHWSMEGREIIREANYSEYQENPAFVKELGMESETPVYGPAGDAMTLAQRVTLEPRGNSLYQNPKYDGVHQWGMSIDLNTCIGCNACVVACQSENNIPIVGRDQAIRGRSMHWIRIDRYYSDGQADAAAFGGEGNLELPEDPQISLQPVACMQCELAPCEMVCPVNATVHDNEGLNVMAYNRCVGTRYCANNCPYKVRRFNYFDWNERQIDHFYEGPLGPEGMPELVKLAKNPEVTVRMRGVMEKCTYCVQRIENGKIQWKVKMAREGTPGDIVVPDGRIKTACQQACPVEAIVFGNILDEKSGVAQAKGRAQDYGLLAYLNTRPRTTYLGRLRNPNSRMPDYHRQPMSRIEYDRKNHPAGMGKPDKPEGQG